MTGTASSKGKLFHDFDSYKNQEWLRRRKLRIEQVRKQSKNIAKTLRQKVENEEKFNAKEFEEVQEAKFRCWRAEKLDEMERKLRCALEEFGLGHKLAEIEPLSEEVIKTRDKINNWKAHERGEIARLDELKRKKLEEEIKFSPIERKKMTRKYENLRSALVCSISARKLLFQARECLDNRPPEPNSEDVEKKITIMKKKVKAIGGKKNFKSIPTKVVIEQKQEKKNPSSNSEPFCNKQCNAGDKNNDNCNINASTNLSWQNKRMIWIDLNDVQNSSVTSCNKSQSSKDNLNQQNENSNRTVEFYDFQSRYRCKTVRDQNDLVEKISSKKEDEIDRLENEEEIKKVEVEKKQKANSISKERGNEALRREKIKQSYNQMIGQLEDLNKKEKIMKSYQKISSAAIYMNDDRIVERTKAKQRIMNSKFESIYYQATSEMPPMEQRNEFERDFCNQVGRGESVPVNEKESAMLMFSPRNLKTNTPVTPTDTLFQKLKVRSPSDQKVEFTKKKIKTKTRTKTKIKKKLLLDIDKALKEGRKLRETIISKWEEESPRRNEISSGEETSNEITISDKSSTTTETNTKSVQNKESQTENLNIPSGFVPDEPEARIEVMDFCARLQNDSLPLSTATSYKSPPNEISCYRLHQVLDCLESRKKSDEDIHQSQGNPMLKKKVKKLLGDLLCEIQSSSQEDLHRTSCEPYSNSTLRYYVRKLLTMSRECVANLSLSSDNNSSMTNNRNRALGSETESVCSHVNRTGSDEREYSNEPFNSWKVVLTKERPTKRENGKFEQNHSFSRGSETTHVSNYWSNIERSFPVEKESPKEFAEPGSLNACDLKSNRCSERIEKAKTKCSKRITELTDLLNKVRRDQELLLDGASKLSLKAKLEARNGNRIDVEGVSRIGRCNAEGSETEKNTCDNDGSDEGHQSTPDSEESATSTETFPDVMDELLRRKMITSPFKWCRKDFANELTTISECPEIPSSIETVICDFRNKMLRIKPFSSAASATEPSISDSTNTDREEDLAKDEKNVQNGRVRSRKNESGSNSNSSEIIRFQENTMESINHALADLGLNWAKSFLRKNSKAISSSSCSDERKMIENEASPDEDMH